MRLKRWPDLPLRAKGLIVVAVPAAATVIIACASYMLGARAAAGEESVNQCLRVSAETQRLMQSETAAAAHLRAYFITRDEAYADKARDTFSAFETAQQTLAVLLTDDPAQMGRLNRIAALQRSHVAWVFGTSARFQAGTLGWGELRAALTGAEIERSRMEDLLRAMQENEERLLVERLRRVATLRAELRATTGICVFFGVIGGVVISVLFASGITNRISRLRENMVQLATGGDLTLPPGGHDEIGALSEGLSRTAEILGQRTLALENALHGIAEADAAGCYVSFNKAYATLTGLREGSLPGAIVHTVHVDDRAAVQAAIDLMRAEGRAETEARIVHPDGREIDAGMTFLPVSKSSAGYYVFLRDIRLRRETEAALVRARDAAVASNKARTEFLAKISHDIRTPLNAILGAANLLSESPLNADQSQYVGMFQRNCSRLVALINDFLDFSQIEAGEVLVQRAPFRIRETAGDAVAPFQEPASRKGIALSVDVEAGIPEWVIGDGLRVQQVLVNLISNAVKFTAAGNISVAVRRTWRSSGEAILYAVSDTGSGMEASDQTSIFAPFTQLPDQDANARGSGLGLTICRDLVGRMGGEIGVTSRKGAGSTFFFHIPLEAGQLDDDETESKAAVSADEAPRGDLVRVLVVEDTEDNRLLVEHYLKNAPVALVFAKNGYEAFDLIRQNEEFDLIFMDIDLPGMDGYATTVMIREWQAEQGSASPAPIVALSAHAMREAVRASLDAGCVAHVAKPIDRATLLAAIHRHARPGTGKTAVGNPSSNTPVLADGVAELVPSYLASKPQQIEDARTCLAAKDFDPIRRFGHNLRGTGPGYGFPSIAQLGKEIEIAAADRDESRIAVQLEALHRMIASHGVAPQMS